LLAELTNFNEQVDEFRKRMALDFIADSKISLG